MSATKNTIRFKTFRELQNTLDDSTLPHSIKCKGYYSFAMKLYKDAQDAKSFGDLEKAFIYFVRFGNLALKLKHAPDFSSSIYPEVEKAAIAISEAELLKSELMKLYDMNTTESSACSVRTEDNVSQDLQKQQMKPTEVHELLEKHQCLIIDLRDKMDFDDSHIKHKFVFNLPGRLFNSYSTSTDLEEASKNLEGHQMFLRRSDFEYVVILDHDTQNIFHAEVPDDHPLRLISAILSNDNSGSKKLKNTPIIINGGYRLWLASYPHMTTNSRPGKATDSAPSIVCLSKPLPYTDPDIDTPKINALKTTTKPTLDPGLKPQPTTDLYPTYNLAEPRFSTEISHDNEPSQLKPQVDRASKPSSSFGPAETKDNVTFSGIKQTHGLRNLGCSCYINASLQCLAHTRSLASYFLEVQYRSDINAADPDLTRQQLSLPKLFENVLYYLYYGGTEEPLVSMWKEIFNIFPQFKRNAHECAYEFITNLLSTLHDVLNRAAIKSKRSEVPQIDENNVVTALNKFFTARQDESRSIIGDLFEGLTCIQRQCRTCKNSSYKFDVTFSLGLPIPDKDELTLDDCLREAFQVQVVDYKCTHCNSQQKATQFERIARLPKILVITFLRFRHFRNGTGKKADNHIKFNNTITLDEYLDCKTQPKSKSYHLYAVVNHYGELDHGHYIAFCKSLTSDTWHKYDDQAVTEHSILADSDKKNTYIAFYTCGFS